MDYNVIMLVLAGIVGVILLGVVGYVFLWIAGILDWMNRGSH